MTDSGRAKPSSLPTGVRSGEADVLRLSVASALSGANAAVVFATGAIIGNLLAPSRSLATLPISVFVVGMAVGTLPAGSLAQRHGRRAAFMMGAGCGTVAGILSAIAVVLGWFWLFTIATFFAGIYAAVVQSFRFAAADCVPPERRARALSTVMAGGVAAGILGPQLVTYTMDIWSAHQFAVTFIAQAVVAVASAVLLWSVRVPLPTAEEAAGGRPLGRIIAQPRFVIAVICGVVSYTVMNFIMTAAPLAMRLCGLPQTSSNLGLQWHIVAMYGPSFFSGRLIGKFGALRIAAVGLVLIALAAAIGLRGLTVEHFWTNLVILGIGWNFSFVGASTMILETHRPEERTRVQSLNDFLVFGTMAVGSFFSGSLLTTYGWDTVLKVSFAPLAIAVFALIVSMLTGRESKVESWKPS